MFYEKIKSLFPAITVTFVLLCAAIGCSDAKTGQGESNGGQNVNFVVKLNNAQADLDNTIESMRLLIFNFDTKELLVNSVVNPADAYQSAERSYLLNTTIRGVRAVSYFVVVNELPAWNLNDGITYEGFKTLEIEYKNGQTGLSDVKPPFVMMASQEKVSTASGSKVEQETELIRNASKVTLKLKQPLNEPLTVKKIYIESVPEKGYLFPVNEYSAGYIKTAERDLQSAVFEEDGNFSVMSEDLVFYIPENMLSEKSNYTCIHIDAERNDSGKRVSYEIVLGAGAGKLYLLSNPVALADLTLADLSIVRNTHFEIEATLGVNLQTNFQVKEWIVKDIIGSIDTPYLNISSINEWLDFDTPFIDSETGQWYQNTIPEKLIFLFWTNVPKDEFKLDEKIIINYDQVVPISELFNYTWTVTEQPDGFIPGVITYSARLELSFKDAINNSFKLMGGAKFNVQAGPLNRTFDVSMVLHPS